MANPVARPNAVITVATVAGCAGALIGAAFAPWWMWCSVGAAAGALYGAGIAFCGGQLTAWLRRGSAVRQGGALLGGGFGAVAAALAGAVAAVARFLPPHAGESADLFAVGALGLLACAPLGFVVGALLGGAVTCFYEWSDTRFVSPLRARSSVVERATQVGACAGAASGLVLVLIFGGRRRSGRLEPPTWLFVVVCSCLALGAFWAVRSVAKRNREAAVGSVIELGHPRWESVALVQAIGFAGGAVGFFIGALLYALGWRGAPRSAR